MIEEYKKYLLIDRHYSENTIKSYINDLSTFISYLNNHKLDAINVDHNIILNYLKSINDLDERSIAHHISVLRGFYKFLILENYIKVSPMENIDLPKLTKKLPNVLSIDEVDKLLDIIGKAH